MSILPSSYIHSFFLFSLLAFLPPIFSPGICLWLVCFLFPILSASLCGKPYEPSALKLATSKNDLWIRSVDLLGYLLGFSVKFLPSVLVCLVNFRLCLHQFCSQTANASVNCGIFDVGTNQTELYQWNGWSGSLHSGLTLAQNVSGSLLVLFVCVISASFVNQRSSLWSRTPFVNLTWLITVVAILLAQLTFFVVDQSIPTVSNSDETSVKFSLSQLPFYTYIIAVVWPIAGILPSVELLKYREILLFNRDQRRRRLAFTTKLGMNSPFG